MAGSLTQLTLINLAWDSVQLSSEFGSVQIEAQYVSVDSVLGSGSALQLEAELVLARSLARRSSMIGPARTRLQARYSAQLCSKLGSVSQFEDRLGVRLGAQLGSPRDFELRSRLGSASVRILSRL